MPSTIQSVESFLRARQSRHNNSAFIERVLHHVADLELQVNVAAGNGRRKEGNRRTYIDDDGNEWWNIRIPRRANTDDPQGDDSRQLSWPLDLHAEAIGSTGWDWRQKRSLWVGFDFDSITGHAKGVGVSDDELSRVREAACAIPWVEVRRSTGGQGLHLYVYFHPESSIAVENHTVHATLARAVLGLMSTHANFDFANHIDVCGGNMWLWHRKATRENRGFEEVKGIGPEHYLRESDIPANWRDNIDVVARKRSKVRISGVPDSCLDAFESLASSRRIVPLDDSHNAVIDALRKAAAATTVWVPDHHLLQTHTCALAALFADAATAQRLGLKGAFRTNSRGTNLGEPNCFAFPVEDGAWRVYRFGKGHTEDPLWEQGGDGWTTCYFNRRPTFMVAAQCAGGIERSDKVGTFRFERAKDAAVAAKVLGVETDLPEDFADQGAELRVTKDGRLSFQIEAKGVEGGTPQGWGALRGDKIGRVFNARIEIKHTDRDALLSDPGVRSLVTPEGGDAGWVHWTGAAWHSHPTEKVKLKLLAMGSSEPDAKLILGGALNQSWTLVNLPFMPEYPGDRTWNRFGAQFRYPPSEGGQYKHWQKILHHCGQDLDGPVRDLPWARENNICSGADYLMAWAACMLREPFQPLPYLFFYGEQNSGKSIFHEALAELMTKGVASADRALTNTGDFNGELANAVLAYVEEKDISVAGAAAYNKIKDWVTSPSLWVHKKRQDAYSQPNTLHFVHTANTRSACPVFPGDTRITMIFVPDLIMGQEIPKPRLLERLRAEAPHFMRALLDLPLPPSLGRLRLPVIDTENKRAAEADNNPMLAFVESKCFHMPGAKHIMFADFKDAFRRTLKSAERDAWTDARIKREIPSPYYCVKPRANRVVIGNLSFTETWEGLPAISETPFTEEDAA